METISLIVAAAQNRVIGRHGVLPWYFPADLKKFKERTIGKPVIMGRTTFQSIGGPLPNRPNIILTASPTFKAPGCLVVHSVVEALEAAKMRTAEIMVIGGGSVYGQFLSLANRIYLTEIHAVVEGGIIFPKLEREEWHEISREDCEADERNPYDYSFTVLERIKPL